MSERNETRWWEGYLVRYLMPSIASAGIILWLAHRLPCAANTLLIPSSLNSLNWPSLFLLLLYANLFCYVSSLPILSFHASREMDFSSKNGPSLWWLNPYMLSVVMLLFASLVACLAGTDWGWWLGFVVAVAFSSAQIYRLIKSAKSVKTFNFVKDIANARSGASFQSNCSKGGTQWWEEITDSYRHMREHGNSGFIFLLQLATAALTYAVIAKPGQTPDGALVSVLILLGIWASPAAFVHMLGQTIERKFSKL